MERDKKNVRSTVGHLKTRAEPDGIKSIEGYFAVFRKETELCQGCMEEIAPEAFDETLEEDIRALINHDSTLVLGRNKANTLFLKIDEIGLHGKIIINENDIDALNLYERVKRGDVNQCSFGFYILEEDTEYRDNGTMKWTIKKVELFEVSVCTFPAYEDTGVQARKREKSDFMELKMMKRKTELKEKLKNGFKTNHAE